MKNSVALILVLCLLPAVPALCAQDADDTNFVWTVGTDTNGTPIQQVEWLCDSPSEPGVKHNLHNEKCPIWAGSVVEVITQLQYWVEVKCDKASLPDETRWGEAIRKDGVVVGWMRKG